MIRNIITLEQRRQATRLIYHNAFHGKTKFDVVLEATGEIYENTIRKLKLFGLARSDMHLSESIHQAIYQLRAGKKTVVLILSPSEFKKITDFDSDVIDAMNKGRLSVTAFCDHQIFPSKYRLNQYIGRLHEFTGGENE